jgi:hypothetical protein
MTPHQVTKSIYLLVNISLVSELLSGEIRYVENQVQVITNNPTLRVRVGQSLIATLLHRNKSIYTYISLAGSLLLGRIVNTLRDLCQVLISMILRFSCFFGVNTPIQSHFETPF